MTFPMSPLSPSGTKVIIEDDVEAVEVRKFITTLYILVRHSQT